MNAPFTYASPTLSVEALKHSIAYKLMFTIGKDPVIANKHERCAIVSWSAGCVLTVRNYPRKLDRFIICQWSF